MLFRSVDAVVVTVRLTFKQYQRKTYQEDIAEAHSRSEEARELNRGCSYT